MFTRLFRKLIPKRLEPWVHRLYWRVTYSSFFNQFNGARCDKLNALKCRISYNQYGGYCVPASSAYRPCALRIRSSAVYEPDTIKLILARSCSGDVVDAGCYFGDFLPAIASNLAPGSLVWAFEPNHENFLCAKITAQINHLENVKFFRRGLADKTGTCTIVTIDDNGRPLGGASRLSEGCNDDQKVHEETEVTALDTVYPSDRHLSVLHLDTEGYEISALRGALTTIERCRPLLILEELPGNEFANNEWFKEHILGLGYRQTAIVHGNLVFEDHSG